MTSHLTQNSSYFKLNRWMLLNCDCELFGVVNLSRCYHAAFAAPKLCFGNCNWLCSRSDSGVFIIFCGSPRLTGLFDDGAASCCRWLRLPKVQTLSEKKRLLGVRFDFVEFVPATVTAAEGFRDIVRRKITYLFFIILIYLTS